MNDEEPLAGDELEALLKKMGADKLTKAYEEVSGKDCGCDKRKEWLNKKHKQLKDWWARITS
jgi:hypothetical protein